MFAKFFASRRRKKRLAKYKGCSVPTTVTLRGTNIKARPKAAVGLMLALEFSTTGGTRSSGLYSIDEVVDRDEFLQAWYTLGGANVEDEDGVPTDPD